jgi:hypothetical protein
MRIVISGIVCFAVCVIIGCSAPNSPSGGTIDPPPIPSTKSILPLNIGNSWEYWSSWYDTSGEKIVLSDRTLERSIPGGFILENDVLINPNSNNYYTTDESSGKYVYKLEWEDIDSGILVRHIGTGDIDKRGLYIAGIYTHSTPTLYREPILWLSYPAKKGTTYTVAFPGEDSSEIVTMQVMETAARFYAPVRDREGASPVFFKDSCYLYKETVKLTESYYYYHPDIGCLGYMKYVNGRLVTSYIMTSYKNSSYRY